MRVTGPGWEAESHLRSVAGSKLKGVQLIKAAAISLAIRPLLREIRTKSGWKDPNAGSLPFTTDDARGS